MFYLIYISSAVKLLSDMELLSLLAQCRENNLKLDITGMLLYKQGNFMQMIEGPQQNVLDLYESIKKDIRHKDLFLIMTGNTPRRSMESWSMGFTNMDNSANHSKYNEFIDFKLSLRSFQDNAPDAYKFITSFNAHN